MRFSKCLCFLGLLTFVCVSASSDDSQSSAALIWQGGGYAWDRRMLGFQVAHRLGDFSNALLNEKHTVDPVSSVWSIDAVANLTVTPGVDGDRSKPFVLYDAVYAPGVRVTRGEVHAAYTDDATPKDHPQALSSKVWKITPFKETQSCTNFATVLRGLRIDIHCNPEAQGEKKCHSNGAWPYKMEVGVEGDSEIEFTFGRAWTPSKGGLKPMDWRLDFNVTVYYTSFCGEDAEFYSTLGPLHTASSEIHEPSAKWSEGIVGKEGCAESTLGVSRFGFELKETQKHKKLGRYIESLEFSVSSVKTEGAKTSAELVVGFQAPNTVYAANVDYLIQTRQLQFGGEAVRRLPVEKEHKAEGQACISGLGFSCHLLGLKEQTNDAVGIRHEIQARGGGEKEGEEVMIME
uniref:Uncharacterized protein n=1 Tax=Chromera velia CCMP2878 TaxID=1169474 RepID=A0A0G4GDE3_9ALVE|eukprot:Cvel_631.t1-p1 / transcript=Cvel_631.t1 / gene=Cvel_631 / organism=Chromera_velia_CCMP2878 / gene_product=hypothetical protein / transcript_product=hypothetical protein / location=Cvel_scaffold19:131420-132628(+) / protein_length=403 / sequence_SO=supercontig / SO=protein_coding / is_pseudo=false